MDMEIYERYSNISKKVNLQNTTYNTIFLLN